MAYNYSLKNAQVCITYRRATEEREGNLYAVLDYFKNTFTDYTLMLIESDKKPTFDWSRVDNPNLNYAFYYSDGKFPKSLLYNLAVKACRSEIVILCDADSIPDPYALTQCVNEMPWRGRFDFLCPFREVVNVAGESKQRFIKELCYENLKTAHQNQSATDMNPLYEQAPGGVLVCRREDYIKVGGYDAGFLGWGGEDNEFAWRIQRFGFGWTHLDTPLFHLHHDVNHRWGHLDEAVENSLKAGETREASDDEFQAKVKRLRAFFN